MKKTIKLTIATAVDPNGRALTARAFDRRGSATHCERVGVTAVTEVSSMSNQAGRYYGRYAAKLQELRSQAAHQRAEQRLKCFNPVVETYDVFDCESQIVYKSADYCVATGLRTFDNQIYFGKCGR